MKIFNNVKHRHAISKEMKIKKSPNKSKNRDSNRNNINFAARKQNDKKRDQKSFESDRDNTSDNKTPKRDIVIIGDSMIKYMNCREM